MARYLLAVLLCAICGCSDRLTQPPEITSEKKEGASQLVFKLSDHRVNVDGSQTFSAIGLLERRTVGFDIQFGPWQENPPGYINMSTWESRAEIRTRGTESDELLQFLDGLYATRVSPRAMAASVTCNAFSPWENPGSLQGDPVKVVLLFNGGYDGSLDAEVWLEIRPREEKVLLREKEPRFRRSLVTALAEKAD